MAKKRGTINKDIKVLKESTQIEKITDEIKENLRELEILRGNCFCLPFLMGDTSISETIVDDLYEELISQCSKISKLDVLIESSGGDLNAAYSLANLFRKFGKIELNFIVPRWAKSAATLLVCGGDKIYMTPVAELGPLDPQITEYNPLEKRLEKFSPLHIEATLELIRKEFESGNEKLANGLLSRLQFPITLGSFTKSMDIAVQYLNKLLSTRMLKGESNSSKIATIARQLTTCYADHGFSINADEARNIGLVVHDLPDDQLKHVWKIHQLTKDKRKLQKNINEKKMQEIIKNMPKELLDKLTNLSTDSIEKSTQPDIENK